MAKSPEPTSKYRHYIILGVSQDGFMKACSHVATKELTDEEVKAVYSAQEPGCRCAQSISFEIPGVQNDNATEELEALLVSNPLIKKIIDIYCSAGVKIGINIGEEQSSLSSTALPDGDEVEDTGEKDGSDDDPGDSTPPSGKAN